MITAAVADVLFATLLAMLGCFVVAAGVILLVSTSHRDTRRRQRRTRGER